MLRNRPERCPYCDHDVRGRLVCMHCREPLPISGSIEERNGWERSYLLSEVPWPRWVFPALLGGSILAVTLVLLWPETVFLVFGAPVVALLVAAAQPTLARVWRHVRGERAPTRLSDACEKLAVEGDALVMVRGRVRTEVPASPFTRYALWKGVGGRFVVATSDGEALIDDDQVEIASHERARDGDLVEVIGPARVVAVDAAAEYRGASGGRIVFEGTVERPLRIRAL